MRREAAKIESGTVSTRRDKTLRDVPTSLQQCKIELSLGA